MVAEVKGRQVELIGGERWAVTREEMEEEGLGQRKNGEEHSTSSSVLERQPFLIFPNLEEIFRVDCEFGGC